MVTKTAPTILAVERAFDEVDERYQRVRRIRRRLSKLDPASKAHLYLMDDLLKELDWLRLKADVAVHLLDDFEESLPEDE
jgi:molybdopterin/thiamine biosynthesis adenylyltransferase